MMPQHWIATDIGTVRTQNEDAFLWMDASQTGGFGFLWVVCDGMGGESAGEIASATTIQAIQEVYPLAMQRLRNPHRALTEALQAANRRLLHMQGQNPSLHKMGTTVIAMAAWEGRAWFAYVGDSRAYVLHNDELHQLTRDHTRFELMREMGVLSSGNLEHHPSQNVLVRALGREGMEVDTCGDRTLPLEGRSFLLCSDGLSGFVAHEHLQQALISLEAQDASEALIELAKQRQSDDNISCAVIRYLPPEPGRRLEPAAFLDWCHGGPLRFPRAGGTLLMMPASAQKRLPPTVSFDFDPSTRWQAHASGLHPVLPAAQTLDPRQPQRALSSGPRTEPAFQPQTLKGKPVVSPQPATAPGSSRTDDLHGSIRPDGPEPRRGRRDLEPGALPAITPSRFLSPSDEEGGNRPRPRTQSLLLIAATASLILAGTAIGLLFLLRTKPAPTDSGPLASAETQTERHPADDQMIEPDPAGDRRLLPRNPEPHQPPEETHQRTWTAASRPLSAPLRWTADLMPAYLVDDGQGAPLYLDAHEVTIAQFQRVLQTDEVLRTIHREVDVPRYRNAPCSTGLTTDTNHPREPVCVSPEAAQRYCTTVGRQLASREDWRRSFAHLHNSIVPGTEHLHSFAHHGAPDPIPDDPGGLAGVYDGLPETLRATELDLARGDIALLEAHQSRSTPYTVHEGLRIRLADPTQQPPMLGFRCSLSGDVTPLPAHVFQSSEPLQQSEARPPRRPPRPRDQTSSGASSAPRNRIERIGNLTPRSTEEAELPPTNPPDTQEEEGSDSYIFDRLRNQQTH